MRVNERLIDVPMIQTRLNVINNPVTIPLVPSTVPLHLLDIPLCPLEVDKSPHVARRIFILQYRRQTVMTNVIVTM